MEKGVAPGSDYPVFETRFGTVGLAMCSEVYMPEVSRALALRGAELISMPAGMNKQRLSQFLRWVPLLFFAALLVSFGVLSPQFLAAQNLGAILVQSCWLVVGILQRRYPRWLALDR